MDLVVTTPGVPTDLLRATIADRGELLVFDRASRCGATTVDPATADRLRVAVVGCAVSLHAADRLCRRFERKNGGESRISVDGVIVAPMRRDFGGDHSFNAAVSRPHNRVVDHLVAPLAERFDCPIVHVDARSEGREPPRRSV